MEKDKLEVIIEDKLNAYESPIDTNSLWGDLQSKINAGAVASAQVSQAAWYASWKLWMGLILIAAVPLSIFLLKAFTPIDQDSVIKIQNPINNNNAIVDQNHLTQELTDEQSLISKGNYSDQFITEKDDVDDLKFKESNNNSNSENSAQLTKLTNQNSINAIADSNDSKKVSNSNFIDIQTVLPTNSNGSNSTVDLTNNNKQALTTVINHPPATLSNNVVESDGGLAIPLHVDNTINLDNKQAFVSSEFQTINQLERMETGFIHMGNQSLRLESMGKPYKIECPSFHRNKGNFNFAINAIPYYSIKQLSNTVVDTLEIDWAAQRLEQESYLETFQINALLKYKFNNGFYIQGGVGYGQLDEKLEVPQTVIETPGTEDGPIIVIIYGPGIPNDTITGDVPTTTIETKYTKTYNYHRMVEIPLAIGFEKVVKNKGFYIDAGASFNILTRRTGYLAKGTENIKFDDPNQQVFKNTTGIKLNTSFGGIFYLENGMSFSIGPDIRYHASNWLRPEINMEQRYLDLGLRLGWSMSL